VVVARAVLRTRRVRVAVVFRGTMLGRGVVVVARAVLGTRGGVTVTTATVTRDGGHVTVGARGTRVMGTLDMDHS